MIKSLTWFEDEGKKRKSLPLRDLRLFLPNRIRKLSESTKHQFSALGNNNRPKEIGLPAIMPRPKAHCFLLDLGALKFLCRKDTVDILYTDNSGSNRRSVVDQFVEDLRHSLLEANRRCNQAEESLAFELQVLEAALAVLVTKNFRQIALLTPILDELITDTIAYPTEIKVGRLAALKKSIYAYNQGIQVRII